MAIEANDTAVLNNLTDEERAAIADPEYSEGEVAAMKNIMGQDPDDDNDDEVLDADGNPVEETKAIQAAPKAVEPAAEPVAAKDEPAAESRQPEPNSFKADLPADFNDKVAALSTKATELAEQFKSGELDFDEYNTELGKVNAQREDLTILRAEASISAKMETQSLERAWTNTINSMYERAAKENGIDYRTDLAKGKDLDQFVRMLGADPDNAEKPMDWFTSEAHKRVMALHGIAAATAVPKPTSRKPPLGDAPQTLAQVPGGDDPSDVSGDMFSNLDNLEGHDLESAIAKMSPDERRRYAMLG